LNEAALDVKRGCVEEQYPILVLLMEEVDIGGMSMFRFDAGKNYFRAVHGKKAFQEKDLTHNGLISLEA
jgi:hypothetical protein